MKALLTFILVSVLAGCSTVKQERPTVVLEEGAKTVQIDPRLLANCDDIDQLASPKDQDVLNFIGDWSKKYRSCKNDKAALVQIVKKAFNIQ